MLERIKPYLMTVQSDDRASFVRSHPDPVFVVLPFSQKIEDTGVVTLVGAGKEPTLTSIGPVRKRSGANRLAGMITIGRTHNNDIEIKASDISKTHAYVLKKGDSCQLVDSGSTNGTFVGSRRLAPRTERVPLNSGDKVNFANVHTIYYSPDDFYGFLHDLYQSVT